MWLQGSGPQEAGAVAAAMVLPELFGHRRDARGDGLAAEATEFLVVDDVGAGRNVGAVSTCDKCMCRVAVGGFLLFDVG